MQTNRTMMLRGAIIFWIIIPILMSLFLIAFSEITVRFFDSSAFGIGFLLAIVPILSAHLVFIAAMFGLIGLFVGLPKDRKFLAIIFLGLVIGVAILHKVYFEGRNSR